MSSAICFNLDQPKILSSGNELTPACLTRDRVRAVDRHCRKMRQKSKCGARFFHLAKVCGDNFLSSNLNVT